ncbi:hypothetical protein ACFYKX_24285 [Cytobacillus sp. FJAT-54145]|uniref:Uncharacterized protein n=1 Tax=Cytobacillus spartinae TaxID=3299023 RepID=A0ABW6KHR9_9BACI
MKSLQDALYNWLTIKIVSDARPDDTAAVETEQMFYEILTEEHALADIEITKDEIMYYVSYKIDGESKSSRFPQELIDVMLNQINNEPEKYHNYPSE